MVLGVIAILLFMAVASVYGAEIESGHDRGDEKIILTDVEEAPTVKINVFPDPVGGYNVRLSTQRFVFAPQNSGKEDVTGEGHAHLYVDGIKIARVYGEWFHIPGLATGTRVIRASLNGNSHAAYYLNQEPIADTVTITVPGASNMGDYREAEDNRRETDTTSTPQTVNQKEVTGAEGIPYVIIFFIILGIFAFFMGAFLAPNAIKNATKKRK